jgi:hypothetical protein
MKYIFYIIIIILFSSILLTKKREYKIVNEVTDTIYKTNTIFIEKPIPDTVYITKYITDTLYTTDSVKTKVNIPISTTIYKDSTYEASVSGFKASLDYFKVFPKETTIYKEKTLEIKEKQPLIKHGIQVGVGYLPLSNKIEPYIGYGLQINF